MNCSKCNAHVGDNDNYYPNGTCDACPKDPCFGCGRSLAGGYVSLMGLCGTCAADPTKEDEVRRLRGIATTDEGVSVAKDEPVLVNSLAGYLDTGMNYVEAFQRVLNENDALKARVAALEEVARFYVTEDDGGSRAMKILGIIE